MILEMESTKYFIRSIAIISQFCFRKFSSKIIVCISHGLICLTYNSRPPLLPFLSFLKGALNRLTLKSVALNVSSSLVSL